MEALVRSCQTGGIAEYLLKISTGTYVPAGPPAAGPTPADIKRGAPAAAVKQSRNQGKKGVYKNPERSAEVHSSIENFRTRVIVMTNDVEYGWYEQIASSLSFLQSPCDVTCYNVESVRSRDLLADMDTPGISLLVRLSSSKAAVPDREYMRMLLDKVRDVGSKARQLGGTVTFILDKESPVGRIALMGKLITEWDIDRVSEHGLATINHESQGRFTILTNSNTIKEGLRGFSDPIMSRLRMYPKTDPCKSKTVLATDLCLALALCYEDEAGMFKTILHGMSRDDTYMSQALLRQCKREVRKSLHVAAPVTSIRDGRDVETDKVTQPLMHKSETGDCKSTPLVATDDENLRESDGGDAESDSKVIAASRPTTDLTNAQYCIETARDDDVVVPVGMHIAAAGEHREITPDVSRICFPITVAKKVPRSKWKEPAVAAALKAELDKLMNIPWPQDAAKNPTTKGKGVWDVSKVREKKDVIAEARKTGDKVHIGYVCPLCFEKGSELPKGHPDRKLRARTVFLGNQVVDEYFQEAEMEGLGSAPPAMCDARAIQAASLAPGYVNTISDADSAYLQTWLAALVATWAAIPKEFWPEEWDGKFYEPCCPLILALYGYTDSGGYWEKMAYDGVKALGWAHVPQP